MANPSTIASVGLPPLCNVYLAPKSVIIDNAGLHRNPWIDEVIRQRDCQVRCRPPSSSGFNPVELGLAF